MGKLKGTAVKSICPKSEHQSGTLQFNGGVQEVQLEFYLAEKGRFKGSLF